jgi:single-strand DNA-binding protein
LQGLSLKNCKTCETTNGVVSQVYFIIRNGGFMNNLNSILIEGTLTKDPVPRVTAKGTAVCNFSLASNRYFKQDTGMEKEVFFFDVETWAKLAESCGNLGKKGRGVRVVGRLRQDRWNGSDGKTHSKVVIVAEHVEFRSEFKKEKEEKEELVMEATF